jgi:hypothetical protein
MPTASSSCRRRTRLEPSFAITRNSLVETIPLLCVAGWRNPLVFQRTLMPFKAPGGRTCRPRGGTLEVVAGELIVLRGGKKGASA